MLAETGSILLALGLVTAMYAAVAALWSIREADRRWWESARNGVYAAAILLGLSTTLLLVGFLADTFSIRYVAQNSSRDLPLYLKGSALWGGQAGSLLLWTSLQAVFAALLVAKTPARAQHLVPWAAVFMSVITSFFAASTLFLSNPFALSRIVPADGQGLNPLLRHPGMVFHPPAMYLGYVGLTLPFTLGLSALTTRRFDDWSAAARPWTLLAWLFLGLGLLLGMRWAYDVLGWGGYWGWDPVENAGLMPWLTATGLLHALMMEHRARGFRRWSVILSLLSFVLVLFGTFTTRSGLIESVHAFARSPLGPCFLGAIAVALAGSGALYISRHQILATANTSSETLFSREGAFNLTFLLLVLVTGSVLIGTVLPTLTHALIGRRFEAGPAWFDRVTGPQFAALVLIMAVCPLLHRAATSAKRFAHGGLATLAGGLSLPLVAAVSGFSSPIPLVALAIVGLAGGTTLGELVRGVVREIQHRQSLPVAVWCILVRNHRRYGGYLVHVGVVLMAIGVIGTRFYPFETDAVLAPGESMRVQSYTLVLEGLEREGDEHGARTTAPVTVYQRGDYVQRLHPRVDEYTSFGQSITSPAVRSGLREDLYVVLAGWTAGGSETTLKVFINPLASFLWLGGLILLGGGTVAFWPRAKRVHESAEFPRRALTWHRAGIGVGIVLLGLTGWALWGSPKAPPGSWLSPGAASTKRSLSRPQVGEPAPDISVDLLDGSTLTLSDLKGQIVVLNFWSPSCQPCIDELPELQAAWREYQSDGVAFVGVSLPVLDRDIEEALDELSVTYPVALDGSAPVTYGITGVPETFVVDQDGVVAHVHIGPVTADTLRRKLDALLSQQG